MTHSRRSIRFAPTPRRQVRRLNVTGLLPEVDRPEVSSVPCSSCRKPFTVFDVVGPQKTRIPSWKWRCHRCLKLARGQS